MTTKFNVCFSGQLPTSTMNKNVRFQREPDPDYDEPQPDYNEPEPDYDDPQPVSAKAVIPQIAARSAAGNLRHMSRSAETEHDLSIMENLNEVSILRVLKERFSHDVIQVMSRPVILHRSDMLDFSMGAMLIS